MKKIVVVFIILILIAGFGTNIVALSPPDVNDVEIYGEDVITLYVGDVITIEATVDSNGVDYAYMLWSSDNTEVIALSGDNGTTKFEPSVSMAEIIAVKPGTAVVSVYADVSEVTEVGDYYVQDSIIINVEQSMTPLNSRRVDCDVYDKIGNTVGFEFANVSDVVLQGFFEDVGIKKISSDVMIPESALKIINEEEYVVFMDIRTDDVNNPYPKLVQNMTVTVSSQYASSGGRAPLIGKNYCLYQFDDVMGKWENITDSITQSSIYKVRFKADKLGKYILVFDPNVYSVEFYMGEPVFVENEEYAGYINCELYYKVETIKNKDVVKFPPIPEKEGYIFTGWKEWRGNRISFMYPQPTTARSVDEIYASWCSVDEYEPIELEISTEEPLMKGQEDGKKIILKTNYGVFDDEEYWYNDWIIDYEAATDGAEKAEILSWHKEEWNVVGSDEIIVKSAKRIDDKTVELTLMGNSSDIYDKSEIQIEFDGNFLLGEPYEEDGEVIYWIDTKIKMDEDGVRAKMYRSDNSVELKKQRRTSSGGGSISYTVMFEENGGSAVENQNVRKGNQAVMPQSPEKEGYVFAGWFADEEFTAEYDFSTAVSGSVTLYAKWDEAGKSEKVENNRIILTIGEKTAEVFGEAKKNDVAPVIKGDRAFIPVRFVAESLGADVIWTEGEPEEVFIRKDDIEIVLNIGSDKAVINGEEITLDASAFLENDRTFVPVRFVFEALGAVVEWMQEEQKVVIAK